MIHLQTKIEKHRLSAFINGLLSGLGLILILWGLSSIVTLPSSSATVHVGTMLFGVFIFVGGGLREAYIWGRFSMQSSVRKKTPATRTQPVASSKPRVQPQQTRATAQVAPQEQTDQDPVTMEQITEYPVGTQTRETTVYEQEKQM